MYHNLLYLKKYDCFQFQKFLDFSRKLRCDKIEIWISCSQILLSAKMTLIFGWPNVQYATYSLLTQNIERKERFLLL